MAAPRGRRKRGPAPGMATHRPRLLDRSLQHGKSSRLPDAARGNGMRRFVILLALAGILVVAGALVFLLWDLDWRWRATTVTRNQAEISQALDQSGWVSPHLTGPRLYVIAYRDCQACQQLEQ